MCLDVPGGRVGGLHDRGEAHVHHLGGQNRGVCWVSTTYYVDYTV